MAVRPFGIQCFNIYPGFITTKMIEGRTHPKLFEKSPHSMAQSIISRIEKGGHEIYIPKILGFFARLVNRVPEAIYLIIFHKRLLGRYYDIEKYHSK
jgi:short-subunit dehydrogenase